MKHLVIAISVCLGGCLSEKDAKTDQTFVEVQTKTLVLGLPLEQVKHRFEEFGRPLEVYNNCTKAFEWPLSPCTAGYSAIGIIPLPSAQGTARRDQAQVYLSFDSRSALSRNSYDLNYEETH